MRNFLKYIFIATLGAASLIGSVAYAGQSVGNIDDSYQVERVTVSLDGKLYAWNGKGEQISNWPIDLSNQHRVFILEPRLMDLDGDSRAEILAVSASQDGSTHLHVYNGLVQELSRWSRDISAGGASLVATPVLSDINNDNLLETIFSTSDSKIHVLNTNGDELSGFPRQMEAPVSLVSTDLQNSGKPKLFGVADSTIYLWESNAITGQLEPGVFFIAEDDNEVIGEPLAHDMDGDSFRELTFSTTRNRIYVVDQDGNTKKTIPIAGDVPVLTQVSVGDVNLDGSPDIIALLEDGTRVAYQANGSQLNDWLKQMEYRQFHEPSVGKIVDDLYNGAFSSGTGWDLFTIYMSSLKNFATFAFGQNVHEYDRRTPFYFAQAVGITDVSVRPLVFTPNGDGVNDTAELHYTLSEKAGVDIDLYDSNQNFISALTKNETVSAGHQVKEWDGIDHRGTRTTNDDKALDTGVYILKIKATSKEGLISTAEAQAVVFGIKAKIETPEDANRTDDAYPSVWGIIGIRGVAADPNIGENNSGFDYNSYKIYYHPGVWNPSEGEVASVGQAGSSWQPISVPLRLQSPANFRNEPNDGNYPNSNVGVSPVQHGILGSWNTRSVVNGEYTILLKVIDGDLNGEHRFSYDFVHVNVLNQVSGNGSGGDSGGDGSGGDGGSGGGGDSGGSGSGNLAVPKIENVNPLNSTITERVRQANINYTLTGKPADINITISRSGGNVVYTQTYLSRASERTYAFSWNSLDNLGRQQPNGVYNILITATAIDGYGEDKNNSASINVNINDSYAGELNIVHFTSSTVEFNPLDTNMELTQRSTTIVYALNKPARSTLEIYNEAGALHNRLLTNHLAQTNGDDPVVWDGTDFNGLILPFGNYVVRLTAFGTEVGSDESVSAEIHISLSSLGRNDGITATIEKLIGDGESDARNDRERGILAHNDNPDDDFPLEGNPDFYWHATGSGTIVPDMQYEIQGWGDEQYWYPDTVSREEQFGGEIGFWGPSCPFCKDFGRFYDSPQTGTIEEPSHFNNFSFTLLDAQSQYELNINVYRNDGSLYASYASSDRNPTVGVGQSLGFTGCPDCSRIYFRFARREPVVTRVCRACLCMAIGCCDNWENIPGNCWDETEPVDDTVVVVRGLFSMVRNVTRYSTRPWGTGDTGWISVGSLAQGANHIGSFPSGSIGTGAGDVVGTTSQNFSYSIREKLNNEYRMADFGSCSGGYKNIPFISAWMGSAGGADTGDCISHSPNIFASLPQRNFSTAQDTTLQSGKISALFSNFNERDYKILSDEINIYDAYAAKTSHPDLYTFSNAVRIADWNIDLKYPNGDPVEAFDVVGKEVHGTGSLDQDGNGIPDVNDNVFDRFRLKLKPDKTPRRFVEIRGNVDNTNYELKFYDAENRLWQDIPVSLSQVYEDGSRTLGFWDVTQLNGRNYTVLLRVENDTGEINEDIINVGIGREVSSGEAMTVRDAFGRTKLHFDEGTLRNGDSPELVSATPVPNNDPLLPLLTLPSGTVPVGPVYNLQPDEIDIDPAHPVQMEITYTCEEVWNAFGSNPAEISVYNLKENGQLELISTLNPAASTCATPNPNEFFTITAMLEHFSDYIMLKDAQDIPTFLIASPSADNIYKNPIHIEGLVSGAELDSLRISYFAEDDIFGERTVFYEGVENTFDFDWESNLPSGEYTMVFEALNAAGLYNSTSIPVHLDVEPPLTKLILDGVVVPNGQSAFTTVDGLISFAADDYAMLPSSAAALIEYKIDNGPYLQYVAPFTLAGMDIGKHEVSYISRDNAGNQEPERKATVIIRGEIAPSGNAEIETDIVVNGPSYESDGITWASPSSSFTIGAIRNSDELAVVSYRISGGEFVRYAEPIALAGSGEGIYLIEYFGTDIYGRDEERKTLKYAVDEFPPRSTLQLNGRYQQKGALNYLVNENTHVSLSAEDSGDFSSGIKKIEYRIGSGDWQNYSVPFTVIGETPLLAIRSVDNADNAEAIQEIQLQFDDEKPEVFLNSADTAFSPNGDGNKDTIQIIFTVSDGFSENLFYSLKVGDYTVRERVPITSGEQMISWDGTSDGAVLREGSYSYELYVEDEAGNRSDGITGSVTLDITSPNLSFIEDASQVVGAGGFTVGYRLNDNIAGENLKLEGSIAVGESENLAIVSDVISIPPNEKVLTWNGRNNSNNALPDGGYDLNLSVEDPSGNHSQIVEKHLSFDGTKPTTLLKLDGGSKDGWISSSTRIILEGIDHGSGIASTHYKFADDPAIADYSSPFGVVGSGLREIHYWSVDNAGNQEEERVQIFNADTDSPLSSLSWHGINRQVDGKDHISGTATELVLEAADEHSGVAKLLFQIDAGGPVVYSSPLSFHDYGDGLHVLKYWSVDEVGNREGEKNIYFVLHGHPPDIQITFGEPKYQTEQLFVTSHTPITVNVSSDAPDITYVQYKIDQESYVIFAPNTVNVFETPIFMIPSEGNREIEAEAKDDYENRREIKQSVIVDNTPPVTTIDQNQRAAGEINLITPTTTFYLNSIDNLVGIQTTGYFVDSGDWTEYSSPLSFAGFSDGPHSIYYRSKDRLNNEEQTHKQDVELISMNAELTDSDAPRVLVYYLTDNVERGLSAALLPDESLSSLEQSLMELFESEPWYYKITTDGHSFIEELRSGAYDSILTVTDEKEYVIEANDLNIRLFREMTERIHGGMTLVNFGHQDNIKGIPWQEMWRQFSSSSDDMTSNYFDMQLYTFGKGVIAQFDSNPVEFMDTTVLQDRKETNEELLKILSSLKPDGAAPSPLEVVGLDAVIGAKERPINVELKAILPQGTELVNALASDANVGWMVDLEPNETKRLRYLVRLPADKGDISFETDALTTWDNGLTYNFKIYKKQSVGPTWQELWQEMIRILDEIANDASLSLGARGLVAGYSDKFHELGNEGIENIEARIDLILDTIWNFSVLNGTNGIEELRFAMDDVLKVISIQTVKGSRVPAFSESAVDTDEDGISDDIETSAGLDPYDNDSDDDGVIDGREKGALVDSDGDGSINALDVDSDEDEIPDGLEMGVTALPEDPDGYGPIKSTDENVEIVYDSDPVTITDMTKADTDGGGLPDGVEDANRNGRVDTEETDPNNPSDDTNPTNFAGGGSGCNFVGNNHGSVFIDVLIFSILLLFFIGMRMRYKNCSSTGNKLIVIAFVFFFLVSPKQSLAGDTSLNGFNALTLHSSSDSGGLFFLYGTQTLGHLKPAINFSIQGFGRTIETTNPVNSARNDLLGNIVSGDFSAALGLGDRVDVGVILPVVFYNNALNVNTQSRSHFTGLGDILLDAKLRILENKEKSVGLGLLSRFSAPTGNPRQFTGWEKPTEEIRLILDKRLSSFYFNLNTGYRIAAKTTVTNVVSGVNWNITNDDSLTFGFGIQYAFPFQNKTWGIEVSAEGETNTGDFKELTTPINVMGGISKKFSNGMSFKFGGGKGVTNAVGSPLWRTFASIGADFGYKERIAKKQKLKTKQFERISKTIHFAFNKWKIPPSDKGAIDELALALDKNPESIVTIYGHTDFTGGNKYNYKLGMRRAQSVAKNLISHGIAVERIIMKSYGETKPAGSNKTSEGRAQNRRVEIEIKLGESTQTTSKGVI